VSLEFGERVSEDFAFDYAMKMRRREFVEVSLASAATLCVGGHPSRRCREWARPDFETFRLLQQTAHVAVELANTA
jgi:hypothetical protein